MNITEDIHQPTRNLKRVFTSMALLLVIFAFVFSWQSWHTEKVERILNLKNIMELGEKAIDAYFTQMKNGMIGLSQIMIDTDDRIDLDQAFILVKQFKESHPELINVTLMREDGQILFTAKAPPSPELPTLAQEPSFMKFREELQQGRPLCIGRPLVSLIVKEWIIPFRFVINNKAGNPTYIISANLPVEILQNFWKDAPFTKTAALGLMRDDGFLISRYPVPKLEMEKIYGIPRTGILINHLNKEKFPVNGYVEGPSSLDGPDHLNAFCRLEHFPISLFITIPMSEIRGGWWNKVKVPYTLTAVLLIGGFLIARWTFRREHAREKERWHVSEILRESENRLDQLAQQSRTITWEVDAKGLYTHVSHVSESVIGYRPDEMVGKVHFYDLHPESEREEFKKAAFSVFDRKERFHNLENTIQTKNGCIVWASTNGIPLLGADGTLQGYRGSDTDITENKLAEMELKEREEQYRLLFESASDALFLIATDTGMVVKANSMASALYGYEPDELLTKRSMDLSAEAAETSRLTNEAQIAAPDKVLNIPLRLHRKKDGTIFPVEITSRSFPLKGQQILLVAARDITERKQAESEKAKLEDQNRQLQKAESLNRMAGAVAHHFNNQLQVVMGNLEMAMDDLPRDADISETLAEAQKAARKAAEVSRLMLTYLGQTPGKQEPINLSETCRTTLTLLQAATPKGMLLKADFPSCGPIIHADAGQIHQILTNLVTNAWESASDNRGAIGLTIKTVSHADIPTLKRFPIDWQPQEIDYACLEVSDTGSGIANKDIEKLFDPFFTTKFTGRGLGLPVVMGIIKAHGGGITVESEQGLGSVFRVFLPVSTEELPCRHDLPAMPEAQQTVAAEKLTKIEGGGTVLLIEDEEQVRNMAKMMLTRLGYTVLEAKDGIEAVEVFQKHQDEIRFVLSDLTMPRMDGWDTLAALRKLSPDIPVILSSGYDEAKVMAEEHTEIPNAFLGKPYQLKGLRETISRVLTAPAGNNGQLKTTN